jgi:exopolyphosphatase/guanosine-5'-triphosphate,3'-diphosphate pyrophosphatase
MIIAEINENGSFQIIDRRREVIRVGSYTEEAEENISREEIIRAIEILKKFRHLADHYEAEIRAAATSAIRESSNGKNFIENIFIETGIPVEIISGKREAELIFLGAVHALKLNQKKVLVIDIGGGSTEIILGNMNQIIFAESLKIGAVRLSRKFFPEFIITPESIELCENYIDAELSKMYNKDSAVYDLAVGASGTILSAASTIYFKNKGFRKINGIQFSSEELKNYPEKSFQICRERKITNTGIEEKRADVLPAGLIILNKLFGLFNIRSRQFQSMVYEKDDNKFSAILNQYEFLIQFFELYFYHFLRFSH